MDGCGGPGQFNSPTTWMDLTTGVEEIKLSYHLDICQPVLEENPLYTPTAPALCSHTPVGATASPRENFPGT